ncbi:hypothetical protein HPB47_025233 [Ixodes persulcatus]|uniref:Uncharacterized protein n=1 Tax=Ixodes persulcatus TaxID=34615 RepID=A0AC60Q242_IXOPE|nr:hypothetical protein HPB47_025233 [Ixodes persulcatus]
MDRCGRYESPQAKQPRERDYTHGALLCPRVTRHSEATGLVSMAFVRSVAVHRKLCTVLYATASKLPVVLRHEEELYFKDPSRPGVRHRFAHLKDEPSVRLSVIVPAYEEEKRLPPMLDECLEYLEARRAKQPDFTYEVIIVDDGSRDRTSEVGLSYCLKWGSDKVRVLTLVRNRGKGGAVRLRSILRTFLMLGFHLLVWLFAVRGVRDTQCGFKLFSREAARYLFPSLHVERWAFDVEMLYIAQRLKFPIREVAVHWTEIEGSKVVPFWSWLEMGRDLFLIWLRYTIGAGYALYVSQPYPSEDPFGKSHSKSSTRGRGRASGKPASARATP